MTIIIVIMSDKKKYKIVFDEEVLYHFKPIDKQFHSFIRKKIIEQLTYEPEKETKNKKPLIKPTFLGDNVWELRFVQGNEFRVFYKVVYKVRVLAVGVKKRSKLYIGGKAVQL